MSGDHLGLAKSHLQGTNFEGILERHLSKGPTRPIQEEKEIIYFSENYKFLKFVWNLSSPLGKCSLKIVLVPDAVEKIVIQKKFENINYVFY